MQFKQVRTENLHIEDWHIRPGETWALLGRNGAGKRLVAALICQEAQPESFQRLEEGLASSNCLAIQCECQMLLEQRQVLIFPVADEYDCGICLTG